MKNSYLALMCDQTPSSTLQISFLLVSQQNCIIGTIIPILQMKKLGVRDTKYHSQAVTAGQWEARALSFLSPVSMTAVSKD